MATKQPLVPYRCTIEINCETMATSESAARRKFKQAVRSIYKDVRVREKVLTYIDEGNFPR